MINLEEIKNDVDKVISYSQDLDGIELKGTKSIVDSWYEAKQYFINAFGGLIYESPERVSFPLSEEARDKKFMKFVSEIESKYGYINTLHWAKFMVSNGSEAFFKNVVSIESEYNGKKISPGMKLGKAYKIFFDDKNMLDNIQTISSIYIQQNKIEGKLCLSVHPLDFLSSSENNCKWRSCHSLDGEYRAGNLSYMLDKSTFICYLKSDEDEQLKAFPKGLLWNSKKWRMLCFLSDNHNALYAGRQYPFDISQAYETMQEMLFERLHFSVSGWTQWTNHTFKKIRIPSTNNDMPLNTEYVAMCHHLYRKENLITDPKNPLHYNDLLKSTCYVPYYSWRTTTTREAHFTIGADCNCVVCGKNKIDVSSSVLCDNCSLEYNEEVSRCPYCGHVYQKDDLMYLDEYDEFICEDCYDEYIRTCDCCGNDYRKEDMYGNDDDGWICQFCHND